MRSGPWSKDRAWAWYGAQPWIRGCNYMPASCANRVDQWQALGCEERFAEMERELQVAESIGFNTLRILVELQGFGVWLEEHDGFLERFERCLAVMARHGMRAIVVLGNDCMRPKSVWRLPKPGPQSFDIGYHGGRRLSQHGSFPGEMGHSQVDDPDLKPKFFAMCEELLTRYRDDARILFWNYGKKTDGKPSDQRLYCFAGTQSYLTPYFSDRVRQRLGGDPDEWKLMFRTLEYSEPVAGDRITVAMGLYMATGKVTIAAPFFIDVTDVNDSSLLIDIAGAKPVRRLAIEHVGVRDVIWQKEFTNPVTDFCEKVPIVTDFRRGMDGRNEIDGHALNVDYVDGAGAKVFAPLEHVFKYR